MGKQKRLLVVDDDPDIVALLGKALSRDFEVLRAHGSAQALEILAEEAVDAILADHMMPGMTGVELLERCIVSQPGAARILLTASHESEVAHDAINIARTHRIVIKPLRLMELTEVVESALREVSLQTELQHKNALLSRALAALQDNEERLEREVAHRTRELTGALAELAKLALRDGLTGLYNHRFFQDSLGTEVARAARYARVLSLLFIDVDHFKSYNDRVGHQGGDGVLQTIGQILGSDSEEDRGGPKGRVSDIVARYGGEEFVVILPETDKAGALVRAERIRKSVEEWSFPDERGQPGGKVTISVGVASFPDDASSREGLIGAADRALLHAKTRDRNCVVPAEEVTDESARAL